jgi:hypothetical protein
LQSYLLLRDLPLYSADVILAMGMVAVVAAVMAAVMAFTRAAILAEGTAAPVAAGIMTAAEVAING